MTTQVGIFADDIPAHYYLEFKLNDGVPASQLQSVISNLWHHISKQQSREVNANDIVLGFSKNLWSQLSDTHLPDDLVDFETINGKHEQVALGTQRDLWCWCRQESQGDVLATALAVNELVKEIMTCELDLPAMVYRESRDLTGFVDGIGNPGLDTREAAALIPTGRQGAGGSILLTQKWVHNLSSFNQLDVDDQERVIGRTKDDAAELSADEMPDNSHVKRTDLTVDGEPLKIFRRSKPYGTVQEHGLYFVGFSCRLNRLSHQLNSMYGLTGDGLHDRLIEFSKAITGSYWFVPSVEQLDEVLG